MSYESTEGAPDQGRPKVGAKRPAGSPRLDRKKIYLELWSHTNRNGVLQKGQQELARELGYHYQRFSEIFSEWVTEGKMKKYKHQFQMVDPLLINWDLPVDTDELSV